MSIESELNAFQEVLFEFLVKKFNTKECHSHWDWVDFISKGGIVNLNARAGRTIMERGVELVSLHTIDGNYVVSAERVPTRVCKWLPFYRVKWRILELLDISGEETIDLLPVRPLDVSYKLLENWLKALYYCARIVSTAERIVKDDLAAERLNSTIVKKTQELYNRMQ